MPGLFGASWFRPQVEVEIQVRKQPVKLQRAVVDLSVDLGVIVRHRNSDVKERSAVDAHIDGAGSRNGLYLGLDGAGEFRTTEVEIKIKVRKQPIKPRFAVADLRPYFGVEARYRNSDSEVCPAIDAYFDGTRSQNGLEIRLDGAGEFGCGQRGGSGPCSGRRRS